MSLMTDGEILDALDAKEIVLTPLPETVQPSSIDVRLSNTFRFLTPGFRILAHDPPTGISVEEVHDDLELRRGEFCLGSTIERIELANDIVARLEGRSSLGRLGLMIHSTAGYIDPGFKGTITLELSNLGPRPLVLRPGIRIAQLSFYRLSRPVLRPYGSEGLGSKYQDQSGPTASLPDAGDQRP